METIDRRTKTKDNLFILHVFLHSISAFLQVMPSRKKGQSHETEESQSPKAPDQPVGELTITSRISILSAMSPHSRGTTTGVRVLFVYGNPDNDQRPNEQILSQQAGPAQWRP